MESNPSSPKSPTHRRRRSSQLGSGRATPLQGHSRRSSSNYSNSLRRSSRSFGADGAGAPGGANGLGSLADELADAWDDEEEEDSPEQATDGNDRFGEPLAPTQSAQTEEAKTQQSSAGPGAPKENTSPNKKRNNGKLRPAGSHMRSDSAYDGSDYGEYSEHELPDIPTSLKVCMADIEGLVKQGEELQTSSQEDPIGRLLEQLKDLGGQAGLENGATRLATANQSLATYLSTQSRTIQALSYAVSPVAQPMDLQDIDALLPLIVSSIEMIPQPQMTALNSMSQLSTTSTDVITSLSTLSDTMHMSRQIAAEAARKLRSARELVNEIRRDEIRRDEGLQWIEDGQWQTRLKDRECASICKDVVGGFEEVCDGWRDKLVASAKVGA